MIFGSTHILHADTSPRNTVIFHQACSPLSDCGQQQVFDQAENFGPAATLNQNLILRWFLVVCGVINIFRAIAKRPFRKPAGENSKYPASSGHVVKTGYLYIEHKDAVLSRR